MARSSKENVPRRELYKMAALSVQIGTPLLIATGEMCVRRKPCRFLRVPAGSVGEWLERRYNSDDEGPLELSTYPSKILHGAQVFRLMEERGDAAELRAEAAEKRSPRTR